MFGLSIACALLLGTSLSQGATYAFVADQPSYTISVGQTVNVIVYFQESHSGISTLEAEDGLFSAGFAAANNVPGAADVQTAANVAFNIVDFTDVAPAVEPFGNSTVSVTSGLVHVLAIARNDPGPTGAPAVSNVNRVQIATLTYTGLAAGTSTITLGDRDPTPAVIETVTYATPDTELAGSSSFTIQVVIPEPATLGMLACGLSMLLRRRR